MEKYRFFCCCYWNPNTHTHPDTYNTVKQDFSPIEMAEWIGAQVQCISRFLNISALAQYSGTYYDLATQANE